MLQTRRVADAGLLLLPGALVVYFAFNAGGFHPGATAYAAAALCVLVAVRVALASSPLAGWSWRLAAAVAAMAAVAGLALLSGAWSHAPGVARVEFDFPLVYLLVLLLMGSLGRTHGRLRWMLRSLATASVIVSTCGLITRLLPHVWLIAPQIANSRLSFPISYWNALGLLAAMGVVLCAHLACDLRERTAIQVLAAAAVPILATTLYFTFSRGAIAVCIISLLVYLLVGRPRGMVTAVPAVGLATALAVKVAYAADVLATADPTTPAGVRQGRHVALVLLGCIVLAAAMRLALALSLDVRLRQLRLTGPWRSFRSWPVRAMVVVGVVVMAVAIRAPLAHDYDRFVHPAPAHPNTDYRARLTDPGSNGRIGYWQVAWRQFKRAAVVGHGAGTYDYQWARYRRVPFDARDAHSLYLETLDELGVVGLLLLLGAILLVLVTAAIRARGSGRSRYGAVFAVLVAWTIHAAVDWDWEMPVVSVVFFALGGFTLGRRQARGSAAPAGADRLRVRRPIAPAWVGRGAAALLMGLLAVVPGLTWLSQGKLDDASYAFAQGDCRRATSAAHRAISLLGNRADAYEILGYCDIRTGRTRAAVAAITKAVSLDPQNWNYTYDLALAQAAAEIDPRPAAARALALNPFEPLVQDEWQTFRGGDPSTWPTDARAIASKFGTL